MYSHAFQWEEKVEKGNKDFDAISAALKKEMGAFDRKRCKDFKANLSNYLEKLMNNEEQVSTCSTQYAVCSVVDGSGRLNQFNTIVHRGLIWGWKTVKLLIRHEV